MAANSLKIKDVSSLFMELQCHYRLTMYWNLHRNPQLRYVRDPASPGKSG